MKALKRNKFIALLAAVMILVTSVGLAYAYFSDYHEATGSAVLQLNGQTEITEDVDETSGQKTIKIVNVGKANTVARVRIYGPDGMAVEPGADWEKIGDYYYYTKILAPGDETSTIIAKIDGIPVDADMDNFDITVIQESALAVIDGGIVAKPDGWENFPTISE